MLLLFLTFLGKVIVPLFFIFLVSQQNGLVIPLYVSYEYKEFGDADQHHFTVAKKDSFSLVSFSKFGLRSSSEY